MNGNDEQLTEVLEKLRTLSKKLDDLGTEYQEQNNNKKNNERNKNVYIFISFDLVNSTKSKTEKETSTKWPFIIQKIYELILNGMQTHYPSIDVWKYVGDELLLFLKLSDIKKTEFYQLIPRIYDLQDKVSYNIQTYFKLTNRLEIKSTVWSAEIENISSDKDIDIQNLPDENPYRNISFYTYPQGKAILDFLGVDVDTGFRIAKFAYHHKVTINADLAYVLYNMRKPNNCISIRDKLKIVSFEELKGIWDKKAYPIIWYCPDWNNSLSDYRYDEYKSASLIENLKFSHTSEMSDLTAVFAQNNINISNFNKNCLNECK